MAHEMSKAVSRTDGIGVRGGGVDIEGGEGVTEPR